MMRVWVLFGVLFLVAIMVSGCGEDVPRTPEGACLHVADAMGRGCNRCFGTYAECYNSVIDSVGGDCANVVEIRDMDALYDECIPWLDFVDCLDFYGYQSSCRDQLII